MMKLFSLMGRLRNPLFLTLASMVLAVFITAFSEQESGQQALADVQNAFARRDATALINRSSDHLEVTIFGEGSTYSRSQATFVMQEFFRRYPPDAVSFSRPSRTEGSIFAAGAYHSSASPVPLQVYVRLRAARNQWELREIRIDRRVRN